MYSQWEKDRNPIPHWMGRPTCTHSGRKTVTFPIAHCLRARHDSVIWYPTTEDLKHNKSLLLMQSQFMHAYPTSQCICIDTLTIHCMHGALCFACMHVGAHTRAYIWPMGIACVFSLTNSFVCVHYCWLL